MSRYITDSNRWVIVTESYSGLLRKGVDLLHKTVADLYKSFLSVYTMDDMERVILKLLAEWKQGQERKQHGI